MICQIYDFFFQVFKASSSGTKVDKANEVAESILSYFPGFDAFKLPPPSSEPDVVLNLNRDEVQDDINKSFLRGVDEFKSRLWSKLSPKYSLNEGEFVTGEGTSICQSICQSVSQSVSQSVCQSISLSVNQSVSQSVCQSISLSVRLSVSQSVCQ